MIIRQIKQWIKRSLDTRGYAISWSPTGTPKGINPFHDLALILKSPAPVVFDVGANEGQTIDSILPVFPTARICAFEPTSAVHERLCQTHGSRCWKIFRLALGECDATRQLTLYDKSVFNSTLALKPSPAHQLPDLRQLGTEDVTVRRLDSVVEELGIDRIDLLKIDTQGSDMEVLRGAQKTLDAGKIQMVMVEQNFFQMYEKETPAVGLMAHLLDQGYGLVDLYEKNRTGSCIAWCTALFQRLDFKP